MEAGKDALSGDKQAYVYFLCEVIPILEKFKIDRVHIDYWWVSTARHGNFKLQVVKSWSCNAEFGFSV